MLTPSQRDGIRRRRRIHPPKVVKRLIFWDPRQREKPTQREAKLGGLLPRVETELARLKQGGCQL
jgi:hypothetical protein